MKSIQLKTVSVVNSAFPNGVNLIYRREYLQLLEVVPDGVTMVEMADLIKVIDKLRAADDDGVLLLEDTEWSTLKKKVESAKFSFVAKEILDMVNAVISAETV